MQSPLPPVAVSGPADRSAGERIYRDGVLPSGAPLHGSRSTGMDTQGAEAACERCHRRSGFGTTEGRIVIPPITGKYLFRPRGPQSEKLDLRYLPDYQTGRAPYDMASLARAIRSGIGRDGRPLNVLMPRYDLDDTAMALLIDYLRQLSDGPAPGVTADTLHFATIITPDADPVKRQAMLDVMQRFVADKNEFLRAGARPLVSDRGVEYRVTRAWELHVWELTGDPDSWESQLDRHLAQTPVFAAISGIGASTWAPVQRFCERARLPCLLPNIDLPVEEADGDFYTVYFSRGVLLEAALIAHRLDHPSAAHPVRTVLQLARGGDVGVAASGALRKDLAAAGIDVRATVLDAQAPAAALRGALEKIDGADALVLWLRAADLRALPERPPPGVDVYLSGDMADLENAPLPAAWRSAALMTYPVDLPERRRARMNFPLAWMHLRHLPVVDERVQTDTYVACGILAEMVGEMLDVFVRDFLVERIEQMVGRRQVNGYYARLGLASGQRFASKGGFLVHLAGPDGRLVVPDGDWVVP